MEHGGSLDKARALFPLAPGPLVDLSTGINPHSYPLSELPATVHRRLPEPARLAQLLLVAGAAYGVSLPGHIVAAPGTQILLPRVMSLVPRGRCAVLSPTYAEHARAAAVAGHEVRAVDDFAALAEADIAVVVNPNNPDGRLIDPDSLAALAERLAARGGLLVVDEAFMDVGPDDASLCPRAARCGAIVLRSFGKFYGLGGVRLGFATGPAHLVGMLDEQLGPWAVSGAAIEIGIVALGDHLWRQRMRQQLSLDAARLDALLAGAGASPVAGTTLFRLVRSPAAPALFEALGQAGIYVRRFMERPEELRFGVPGEADEWARLATALDGWSSAAATGNRLAAR